MKKITLILLLLLMSSTSIFAQSKGYYNRKNYVMVSSSMYFPLLRFISESGRFYNSPMKVVNNKLDPKLNIFRYDLQVTYMRTITKRAAIGFDFGYANHYLQRPTIQLMYPNGVISDDHYYFERQKVNIINITPKIEFSKSYGIYPIGITHQFGFGLNFASLADKKYSYALGHSKNYYESTSTVMALPSDAKIKDENNSVMFLNLYYGLTLKVPITQGLFFNAGMRINLNLFPYILANDYFSEQYKNAYESPISESLDMSKNDFRYSFKMTTRNHFVNMNIGFGYTF